MIPAGLADIANHLWQSTLFAAGAALLTITLRNYRAEIRYRIWLAASMKFVVPFALMIDLGNHLGRRAGRVPPPRFSFVVDQASQPFVSYTQSPATPLLPVSHVHWVSVSLLAVWAIGAIVLLCFWCRRWRAVRLAFRGASAVELPGGLRALVSRGFTEPGVFGIRRPLPVLPAGITERLTPAEFEAVIAHERCHIRRRDNLAAALQMFVEALFWFHPLVWWLGARLMTERERACDEEVLRRGSRPEAYAEGILKVCELYLESSLACVSGVTGADLRQRIEQIMTNRIVSQLNFARKLLIGAAVAAAVAAPVITGILNAPAIEAQVPAGHGFEVVSVKRCEVGPGRMRDGGNASASTLRIGCDLLADENGLGLIQAAFVRFSGGHTNPLGVIPIVGGPKWIHTDAYSIQAKAEGNFGREMMQGPMLQALLEDRFKLKIHRETRPGPVYALTRAGGALKLKPFSEGSCRQMPLTRPMASLPAGQRYCKQLVAFLGPSLEAEGSTLAEFSKLLNLVTDRPVIDQTGISGRFNIHLEFARDQAVGRLLETPGRDGEPPPPSDSSRPTIFTAVQEQLGLKLTPARGPVESLVVDHIERPSEN
jgi:bla regulator protein BlaR1